MSLLFSPLGLRSVTLRNRVAISPMSQYSALEGMANDWHLVSLGARAAGGAGLVMVEATSVSPEGRGTPGDLGLWNDLQIDPLARVAAFIRSMGAVPGIQLQHSGAKACTTAPWEGGAHIPAEDDRAWPIHGASDAAFGVHLTRNPQRLDQAGIDTIVEDFGAAARRAARAGFELVQIHAAHGYLIQGFLSPLSNDRTDGYGSDADKRARLLREIVAKVRSVWPDGLPLSVRIGASDFNERGVQLADMIELSTSFGQLGVDLIDVSIAFSGPIMADLPWKEPAFMAPVAAEFRHASGIATAMSWAVDTPEDAERVLQEGCVDVVMLARPSLFDPNWPLRAAVALGEKAPDSVLPIQHGHWLKRWFDGGRVLR
jgi:2,4-dienoyl-CoA reductase-like NADH-dependent reductase (Old Yellow Enzyme family)